MKPYACNSSRYTCTWKDEVKRSRMTVLPIGFEFAIARIDLENIAIQANHFRKILHIN